MKKVISRLATLSVMITAGFLLYNDLPVKAASCWETAYNKWQNCDNNYSATLTTHYYSPQTCAATAQNSCQHHPPGTPAYNSCYNAAYTACIAQDQQNYDNRGSSYGSCLGFEGNGGNCVEQLESCDPARDRASACNGLYAGSEDGEALSTCLNNSGIYQCQ